MKRLIFIDVFAIVFFAACGDNALPAEPTCFREPDYDAYCQTNFNGVVNYGFYCEDDASLVSPDYPKSCFISNDRMCCTTED